MDILFQDGKLQKECNDYKLLKKRHGEIRAKFIRRRLDELEAAEVLDDMRNLPAARCHELRNRGFELAVNLDQPYRLIFTIANTPIPKKPDGGLDWKKVSAITILRVENYHG